MSAQYGERNAPFMIYRAMTASTHILPVALIDCIIRKEQLSQRDLSIHHSLQTTISDHEIYQRVHALTGIHIDVDLGTAE